MHFKELKSITLLIAFGNVIVIFFNVIGNVIESTKKSNKINFITFT